jgi:hypothetical protein
VQSFVRFATQTLEPKDASSMTFMPGLELSELLFRTTVEPVLANHAPGLAYAAGLIGAGSDVLGFDTERSTDHDWGPRLMLFLAPADLSTWQERLHDLFRHELPTTVAGIPRTSPPRRRKKASRSWRIRRSMAQSSIG